VHQVGNQYIVNRFCVVEFALECQINMNLECTLRFMTCLLLQRRGKLSVDMTVNKKNLHFVFYEKFYKLRFQVFTAVNITNIDYVIKLILC